MDLSKTTPAELAERIDKVRKNPDWPYVEEAIRRQMDVAYKGLRTADDLHRIGKFQGQILAYRWVLQDVDK